MNKKRISSQLLEYEKIDKYIWKNIITNINKNNVYAYVESNLNNFIDIGNIDNTYLNIKSFMINYILTEVAEEVVDTFNVGPTYYAASIFAFTRMAAKWITHPQDSVIRELYDDLMGSRNILKIDDMFMADFKLNPGVSYSTFEETFKRVRVSGDYSEFFKIIKPKIPGFGGYFSKNTLPDDIIKKTTDHFNNLMNTKYKDINELVKSREFVFWIKKYSIPRVPAPVLWDDLQNRVIPNNFKDKVGDYFKGSLHNIKSGFKYGIDNSLAATKEFGLNLVDNTARTLKEVALTGVRSFFTPTTVKGMFAITIVGGFLTFLSEADFGDLKHDAVQTVNNLNENNFKQVIETVKNSEIADIIKDSLSSGNAENVDVELNNIISGKANNIIPEIPPLPKTITSTEFSIIDESGIWDKAKSLATSQAGIYGVVVLLLTICGILIYRVIGRKIYEKKFK